MILSNLITLKSRLEIAAAAIVQRIITRSAARVLLPVLPPKKTSVVAPAIMEGVEAPRSLLYGEGALKLDGERESWDSLILTICPLGEEAFCGRN